MYLSEIFKNTDYTVVKGDNCEIKDITIDSRKVIKGSMFICIRGLKSDGHDFIFKAVEAGACAVVCDRDVEELPENVTIVRVSDSREILNTIASNFYGKPEESLSITAVTGTNGKTSTTYFIETILKADGKKCAVIGTSGVVVDGKALDVSYATSTTPDTIELYSIFKKIKDMGVKYVVMEVSSHALALKKVDNLRFDVGVFTNLTQDHLDFHGNFENYFEAKAKLFSLCKLGIINADDEYGARMAKKVKCNVLTFGIDSGAYYKGYNIKHSDSGSSFDLKIFNDEYKFKLNIPGRFSVYNALGAIAACINLGVSVHMIRTGIEAIRNVPGRIQPIKNDKGFTVFVDYAHSPDGLKNIIESVRFFTKGRIITVFGCGGDRDRVKRSIMGGIAGKLSDICVITSDNPRSEKPEDIIKEIENGIIETKCEYFILPDRKEAIFEAVKMARKGDSIIIAGKGHENYQEFENGRRIFFDDAVTAEEALEDL